MIMEDTQGRHLRTLDDLPLDGKRVIVRVDFNLNAGEDGVIQDEEDYRIEAAMPTIQELQQRRCRILLLAHMGRPQESSEGIDLTPVRHALEDRLKEEVRELSKLSGDSVEAVVTAMDPGTVALYPNVRLDNREMSINQRFGEEIAQVADAYVNEAFSVSHRAHTSMAVLPRLLPSCAGRRTVMEVEELMRLKRDPKRPYVAIVSGSKIVSKVGMLRQLLTKVDTLCVGGQVANVFIAAKGMWPRHDFDANEMAAAKALLSAAGDRLLIPSDVVTGRADGSNAQTVPVEQISDDAIGLWDIGPSSVKAIVDVCRSAQTVMWNGPVGKFETEAYSHATQALAEGLAELNAYRVVGGGDTVHALEQYSVTKKYDHVSVGGGAMISLLEGKRMPGLEPLLS